MALTGYAPSAAHVTWNSATNHSQRQTRRTDAEFTSISSITITRDHRRNQCRLKRPLCPNFSGYWAILRSLTDFHIFGTAVESVTQGHHNLRLPALFGLSAHTTPSLIRLSAHAPRSHYVFAVESRSPWKRGVCDRTNWHGITPRWIRTALLGPQSQPDQLIDSRERRHRLS